MEITQRVRKVSPSPAQGKENKAFGVPMREKVTQSQFLKHPKQSSNTHISGSPNRGENQVMPAGVGGVPELK